MRIAVKVVPKASADEVVGWMGTTLKVRVTAPPQRGRANEALEQLLAREIGVARGRVRVVAGHGAPRKWVDVEGLDADELLRRLPARKKLPL